MHLNPSPQQYKRWFYQFFLSNFTMNFSIIFKWKFNFLTLCIYVLRIFWNKVSKKCCGRAQKLILKWFFSLLLGLFNLLTLFSFYFNRKCIHHFLAEFFLYKHEKDFHNVVLKKKRFWVLELVKKWFKNYYVLCLIWCFQLTDIIFFLLQFVISLSILEGN